MDLKKLHQSLYPMGLAYQHHLCKSKKKSDKEVTLLIQGRNEFMGMYSHIIPFFLHEIKTDLFMFDLRGQGHSSGIPAHINSFQEYLHDLKAIVETLRTFYSKVHIVSHSTGGLISGLFVGLWPASLGEGATVFFGSPFFGLKSSGAQQFLLNTKLRQVINTYDTIFRLFPDLRMKRFEFSPTPSFKENSLTTDHFFYESFDEHSLKCGPPTWCWLNQCMKAQIATRNLAHTIKLPIFMALAEQDSVVNNHANYHFFLKGKRHKRPWVLKRFRGMKHSLFLSPKKTRERLLNMIKDFQKNPKDFYLKY